MRKALVLSVALLLATLPTGTATAAAGFDARYSGQSDFLTLAPGETGTFTIFVTNTGTTTWVKGTSTEVDLATCRADKLTCNAQDDTDAPFNTGTWKSATRYASMSQASVATNQVATFTYSVRPPFGTIQGIYRFNSEVVIAQSGETIHPEGFFQDVFVTAAVARIELTPETDADEVNVAHTVTATYYNAAGAVVSGVPIDVFVVRDANPFGSTGACSRAIQALPSSTGTDACKIDDADPKTDSSGKVTFTWSGTLQETHRVIAWTGNQGTTYSSTQSLTQDSATMVWYGTAGGLDIDPDTRTARYAGGYTASAQLEDNAGDALPVPGLSVIWQVFRGGLDSGVTCSGGTAVEVKTVSSDSSGRSTFTYTGPPDPAVTSGHTTTDCVFSFYDRNASGIRESNEPADAVLVTWSDQAPGSGANITVSPSTVGLNAGATHTVTIALRDVYADPIAGKNVTLQVRRTKASTYVREDQGIVIATTLASDSSGTVTYAYTGPAFGATDTIDACADINLDGDCTDSGDVALTQVTDATVHWTSAAVSSTTTKYLGRVLLCDKAARTLYVYVLSGPATGNLRFTYDLDDQFYLDNDALADDSIDGTAKTLAIWEDKCATDDPLVMTYVIGGTSHIENEGKSP